MNETATPSPPHTHTQSQVGGKKTPKYCISLRNKKKEEPLYELRRPWPCFRNSKSKIAMLLYSINMSLKKMALCPELVTRSDMSCHRCPVHYPLTLTCHKCPLHKSLTVTLTHLVVDVFAQVTQTCLVCHRCLLHYPLTLTRLVILIDVYCTIRLH